MNTPIEDLFALAKEAAAPVIWTHKKAHQKFQEAATPGRLIEVSEAFWALLQRAEAAEAALERESDIHIDTAASMRKWRLRAEAAEAKLADLDKQEPVAWISQSEMALIRPTDKRCVEATLWGVQRFDEAPLYARPATALNVADLAPKGWKLVPVEPTEDMVIQGFESEPKLLFSDPEDWDKYESMSGCQQAAHKARLCWAAMLEAAPTPLQ